jgi:hypothetical protein
LREGGGGAGGGEVTGTTGGAIASGMVPPLRLETGAGMEMGMVPPFTGGRPLDGAACAACGGAATTPRAGAT